MNYNELRNYSEALANMSDWNYTTFIRTYYKLKPHLIVKWSEKLIKHKNIHGLFVAIETDQSQNMNHLHLAFSSSSPITQQKVMRALNIHDKRHIGNIEPILEKTQIIQYISKHIIKQKRYVNGYYDLFFKT